MTFWDTFESAVHNNPTLTSIDKFNYLNSLLESTASEAISGLTLTSANYEEAIATLKRRFGNKQLIVNRHMDLLLNLETTENTPFLIGNANSLIITLSILLILSSIISYFVPYVCYWLL